MNDQERNDEVQALREDVERLREAIGHILAAWEDGDLAATVRYAAIVMDNTAPART